MATPTLTAGRAKPVNLVINDKKGNPARVDGMPVWTSSDESVATVTPSEDGMSATILSLGTTGTAQISVTADADLGEGVREMTGSALIDVIAGEAFAFALMLGEDFDPPEAPVEPEPTPEEPTDEEPVDETPVDEEPSDGTDTPVDEPTEPVDPDAPAEEDPANPDSAR